MAAATGVLDVALDEEGERERDMVDEARESIPLLSIASAPRDSLGFLGLLGGSPGIHRRAGVPGRESDTDLSEETEDLLTRDGPSLTMLCRPRLPRMLAGTDWLLDSSWGIRVGTLLLLCLLADDRADFLDFVDAAVDEDTEFWRDILVGVFPRDSEGAGDGDVWRREERECERGRGFLLTSEFEAEADGEILDARLLGVVASDVVRRRGIDLADVDGGIAIERVERTDAVREKVLPDNPGWWCSPPAPAPTPALDPGLLLLLPTVGCDVVLDSGDGSLLIFEAVEALPGVFGLAEVDFADLVDLTEPGAEPAAEWAERTERAEPALKITSELGDDADRSPLFRSAADDIEAPVRTEAERICEASDLRLLPLAAPPGPAQETDDEASEVTECCDPNGLVTPWSSCCIVAHTSEA